MHSGGRAPYPWLCIVAMCSTPLRPRDRCNLPTYPVHGHRFGSDGPQQLQGLHHAIVVPLCARTPKLEFRKRQAPPTPGPPPGPAHPPPPSNYGKTSKCLSVFYNNKKVSVGVGDGKVISLEKIVQNFIGALHVPMSLVPPPPSPKLGPLAQTASPQMADPVWTSTVCGPLDRGAGATRRHRIPGTMVAYPLTHRDPRE